LDGTHHLLSPQALADLFVASQKQWAELKSTYIKMQLALAKNANTIWEKRNAKLEEEITYLRLELWQKANTNPRDPAYAGNDKSQPGRTALYFEPNRTGIDRDSRRCEYKGTARWPDDERSPTAEGDGFLGGQRSATEEEDDCAADGQRSEKKTCANSWETL